jgi:hypothetical protein
MMDSPFRLNFRGARYEYTFALPGPGAPNVPGSTIAPKGTAGAERHYQAIAASAAASRLMDSIGRRFDALDRMMFEIDKLEARIARLEQRPPTPLGGRELQRQRVEAVLRARRDGHSHRQIAGATGVSQAGVRRILQREGDPSPRLPGGQRPERLRRVVERCGARASLSWDSCRPLRASVRPSQSWRRAIREARERRRLRIAQ